MKKILTLCWIVAGSLWVHDLAAQQGGATPANAAPVRSRDKDEFADEALANWEQLKKSYQTRTRKRGPFGVKMDPGIPDEIVYVPEEVATEKAVAIVKVASLQEAVNKFQVNGVNPKKQMVMVGFRPVRRGEIVEINHDGELFKLRIVKIAKDEVVFMNVKNEETASVRLGVVVGFGGAGAKSGKSALENSIIKKGKPVRIE